MSSLRTTDEAEIRQRIDTLLAALRAMDLAGVMALYAPDIVSFDIAPPCGTSEWGRRDSSGWTSLPRTSRHWGTKLRDLSITLAGDVAFVHSLNRISGTLPTGGSTDLWLRWTAGLRKIGGAWLIVHDHVSVPADFASGRAMLDLQP